MNRELKIGINVKHFLELLYLLVQKDLKVRYKSSVLGYLWALANPFAFALVYYVAFKIIMRVQMPNYSVFLLTGMFPWVWFTNSLIQASASFKNNVSLVKKVNLVRAVLPLGSVIHEMVHFCFALPVLCCFIFFTGGILHLSWLWQLPLMVMLQLSMAYPLALILAVANVYVHDVEYIVGIGLSLLFFLTPIVYPVSMIPDTYRHIFEWNPLVALVGSWRSIFLEGNIDFKLINQCITMALIMSFLSIVIYRGGACKLGELL
ncbi:ABC transporter permease [Methylomonas sp. SURF-2]|uniref:Transport permease protein n=1 Tax=Methylomonas subterranea TaxID=2952225 RepID=A0ABT1TAL4_9GAMM|nr:ABC transporter permease [Methylomonas sp. SURF-2]MCQ8102488.1 ABC transporter permease [Methylomonas sp. SURF-2]